MLSNIIFFQNFADCEQQIFCPKYLLIKKNTLGTKRYYEFSNTLNGFRIDELSYQPATNIWEKALISVSDINY